MQSPKTMVTLNKTERLVLRVLLSGGQWTVRDISLKVHHNDNTVEKYLSFLHQYSRMGTIPYVIKSDFVPGKRFKKHWVNKGASPVKTVVSVAMGCNFNQVVPEIDFSNNCPRCNNVSVFFSIQQRNGYRKCSSCKQLFKLEEAN